VKSFKHTGFKLVVIILFS